MNDGQKNYAEIVNKDKYKKSLYEINRSGIIEKLLPPAQKGAVSALDIGCGTGWFSKILTDRGWEVTALEAEPSNLQAAAPYVKTPLLGNALSLLPALPPDSFDLGLALEIIEHMDKDTAEVFLKLVFKTLKPGGLLLISTPNKFSPIGLTDHYIKEKLLGREKWTAWDKNHIHIYNSFEFIALLKKSGFSLKSVTGLWYDISLKWHMPLFSASIPPLNMFGFDIIALCSKP